MTFSLSRFRAFHLVPPPLLSAVSGGSGGKYLANDREPWIHNVGVGQDVDKKLFSDIYRWLRSIAAK